MSSPSQTERPRMVETTPCLAATSCVCLKGGITRTAGGVKEEAATENMLKRVKRK